MTAGDQALFAAWAVLQEISTALTAKELSDAEFERLCTALEREQTVIMRTPATTATGLAIKLRCVLDAMVDKRSVHVTLLHSGMPDAAYLAKAEIPEQMLWSLVEQVEAAGRTVRGWRGDVGDRSMVRQAVSPGTDG